MKQSDTVTLSKEHNQVPTYLVWIPLENELGLKWTQQMWNNSTLFHNKTKCHIKNTILNTWSFGDNLKLVKYKNVKKKCGKFQKQ